MQHLCCNHYYIIYTSWMVMFHSTIFTSQTVYSIFLYVLWFEIKQACPSPCSCITNLYNTINTSRKKLCIRAFYSHVFTSAYYPPFCIFSKPYVMWRFLKIRLSSDSLHRVKLDMYWKGQNSATQTFPPV